MYIRIAALLLALLLAPCASAEPSFEGGIGLGLGFYTTRAEVEQNLPEFLPDEMEGAFAAGTCALMGRGALVFFERQREALVVTAVFSLKPEDSRAAFEDMMADIGAIWGEAQPAGDGPTLDAVADGSAGGTHRRDWAAGQCGAALMLYGDTDQGGARLILAEFRKDGAYLP